MPLRPYQKEASDAAVTCFQRGMWNGLLSCPTGCHAKGTGILMYDGTVKRVEEIHVGDMLMGIDSTPRTVLELHHGTDEMFEIQPKIGDAFVVNGGHILSLYKTKEGDRSYELPRVDEISVYDYLKANKTYKHTHKLRKPSQIDFGKIDGIVGEPYLLGLYLGDGSSVGGCFNITTMRTEIEDYLRQFCEKCGYNLRMNQKPGNKAKTFFITDNGTKAKPNQALEWLRDIGVYGLTAGDKHIPHQYKTASVKDRYQLLAGLLDTDAWYDTRKGVFEYCTKSLVMAKDIQFVCRSLGFMCNIGKTKVVNGVNYYRMQISGDLEKIPTKVAIRQARPRKMNKSVLVTGFDVTSEGLGVYYGFTINGDHLYIDEQFFIHHNCGKSYIIADVASRLDAPLLVFQPSREILLQNYEKILNTGICDVGIYSASLGMKNIRRITLATIGSVHNHMDDFRLFKYVIVDEAHRVNAVSGMYKDYLMSRKDRCVIGLTATPFRLSGFMGCVKTTFLTRLQPRIYDKVLYVCQVGDMMDKGYLSKPRYFDVTGRIAFRISNVKVNTTGMDYDEKSLEEEYERSNFAHDLLSWTLMVLKPNDGSERKGVIVFTRFVREAEVLTAGLRGHGIAAETVTAKTGKDERMRIVDDFKNGKLKVCSNAGVMLEGFDYPALDTVIVASPTRSLTRWCQMCLDMETEVLTNKGFLRYNEITSNDKVASYDNGKIKFVPILEIIQREAYDGEKFVSFSNHHIDFRVTGEHKMLVKSRNSSSGYVKEDAIEMIKRKSSYVVPVSGIESVEGADLSDEEIKFLGWCVSDGSLDKSKNTVGITQSIKNTEYVKEIETCIQSCGLRYSKLLRKRIGKDAKYCDYFLFTISYGDPLRITDREKGLHGWNKYEKYIKGCKIWSDAYELFNEHQFDVFIETIYHADGSHRKAVDYNINTMSICGGIYKDYCNRLQSLAVRRGYRVKLSSFINKYGHEQFMMYFKKVSKCDISGTGIKDGSISSKKSYKRSRPIIEDANGNEVWCVRNKIGTIITRRNGKVVIMGNCGRVLRPYPGKQAWVVDLSGNYRQFGKMEDMRIENLSGVNQWVVTSNGRQLTGIIN